MLYCWEEPKGWLCDKSSQGHPRSGERSVECQIPTAVTACIRPLGVLTGALQREGALGGERLCGELGRLRMADTAVEGVILRVLAGERPPGFKNTAYWQGVGVTEFWRKRVRLRGELSERLTSQQCESDMTSDEAIEFVRRHGVVLFKRLRLGLLCSR